MSDKVVRVVNDDRIKVCEGGLESIGKQFAAAAPAAIQQPPAGTGTGTGTGTGSGSGSGSGSAAARVYPTKIKLFNHFPANAKDFDKAAIQKWVDDGNAQPAAPADPSDPAQVAAALAEKAAAIAGGKTKSIYLANWEHVNPDLIMTSAPYVIAADTKPSQLLTGESANFLTLDATKPLYMWFRRTGQLITPDVPADMTGLQQYEASPYGQISWLDILKNLNDADFAAVVGGGDVLEIDIATRSS
jgi:hypothetical protein